jgi:hypothetical protein
MATIYLSSTYEDLKDYRRAVYEALRKAGHQVIAMEDYVATDQRPVNKCLKDVELADIYVGFFAFRYGDIPGGFKFQVQRVNDGAKSRHFRGRVFNRCAMAFNSRCV